MIECVVGIVRNNSQYGKLQAYGIKIIKMMNYFKLILSIGFKSREVTKERKHM